MKALLWVMLAVAALAGPARAADNCAPAKRVRFICGVSNVEDFAPVPGTRWVIGSDLALPGQQGFLWLFDTSKATASAIRPEEIAIQPDRQTYPDCPGPVDWKIFGPHGLDLTRSGGLMRTLYAVNHGGRDSVEVFRADFSKPRPRLIWIGCVVAPHGFWPDAVASVPGNGIMVTSLWDPTDPDRLNKLSNGQPVGGLDAWYPGKGWKPVPGTGNMSGPNGVIVDASGKVVYLALWSGKQVARIDLRVKPPRVDAMPTGFLADNVRWSPSGRSIFVGGQDATVQQVLDCFESSAVNCAVPFKIERMNPRSLKPRTVVKSGVYGEMGAGTGAIQVGRNIWVSSFRADRIGIFPAK